MPTPSRGEWPILQASIDLIRWFVPLRNGLPRAHNFALDDCITANLYDLLEGLLQARSSRQKLTILEPLTARLDLMRVQTRLLHDFQQIDMRCFAPPACRL